MERRRSLEEFQGSVPERLRQAAEDLAAHPGTVLTIPPGDYRLCTPLAAELRRTLMAGELGDDPEKTIFVPYYPYDAGLLLKNVRDCVIEAAGARFLLGGPMEALELSGCRNITVRGLTVDCEPKPYAVGALTGAGEGYVDILLPPDSPVTEHTPAPRIVALDGPGFGAEAMESFSRERVGEHTIRYYGTPDLNAPPGAQIALIHTYHYRPAVYLDHAENITLEGVAVHAQYGMGLLAYRCRDVLLRRCAVAPSEGAPISTNTDATHFVACDGEISLEECRIARSEDDGVNIHSYYYDAEPLGGAAYLLRVNAPTFTHPQVIDCPLPGERLALCDGTTLEERSRYQVLKSEPVREALAARVVLDRPLEGEGLLLNRSLQPRLTVRRCEFQGILTRCLLIKAARAEVNDCTFRDCTGTAIHIAPEPEWREGGETRLVRILNNQFHRVGVGTYGVHGNAAAVCVCGGVPDGPRLHGTVEIRNNRVTGCRKEPVVCSGVERLILAENECPDA